jgi:hypothetical protein
MSRACWSVRPWRNASWHRHELILWVYYWEIPGGQLEIFAAALHSERSTRDLASEALRGSKCQAAPSVAICFGQPSEQAAILSLMAAGRKNLVMKGWHTRDDDGALGSFEDDPHLLRVTGVTRTRLGPGGGDMTDGRSNGLLVTHLQQAAV